MSLPSHECGYSGRLKYAFSVLIFLIGWSTASVGENQSSTSQSFHWNWRDTQTADHTLAEDTQISTADKASLLKVLTLQFKGDPQPSVRAAETRIKAIDLNGDGVPEIIAQTVGVGNWCSPTGNCAFWVFQKAASGYKVILDKGAVQSFTVQAARNDGFSDLVLAMHGSATEQDLYLYRFSHGSYHRTACYDANWEYLDKNGELHELKEPRITHCQQRP